MTDPNQPNNDQGWNAPQPNQPAQSEPWNQPASQGNWNQPPQSEQPGQWNQPQSEQPAQWNQPAQPEQPGQWNQPGGYPAPGQPGQYPPPGQFGAPGAYGAPGFPPPPPAKRKTGKILGIVGAAVVVVVVAAIVIASLVNKHSDKIAREHSLTVPSSAGGLVLQNSDAAKQVSDTILSGLQSQNSDGVWTNPKVGVYGKQADGNPEVILMGLNVADSKALTREMGTHSLSDEAKSVLKGAGLDDAKDYDAGSFGGELKCGSLPADSGQTLATCIWLDHSTMGMVMQIDGTPDQTAVVAKNLREAGEK